MRNGVIALLLSTVASTIAPGCAPLIVHQKGEDGKTFCSRLSGAASGKANVNFGLGIGLSVIGVGAAGAATVMTSAISSPSGAERAIEGVLPLAGAAALVLSKVFFSRETAASTLAATADRNIESTAPDNEVLAHCLEAKAQWEEARDNAAQIAKDMFKPPPPPSPAPAPAEPPPSPAPTPPPQ